MEDYMCKNKYREIKVIIKNLIDKAELNHEPTISIDVPNRLKAELFNNRMDIMEFITTEYKDYDAKVRSSELGEGWYNGWALSRARAETNKDVPEDLLAPASRVYNKRGETTAKNFKLWVDTNIV